MLNEPITIDRAALELSGYLKTLNDCPYLSNGELRRIRSKVCCIPCFGSAVMLNMKQDILKFINERVS